MEQRRTETIREIYPVGQIERVTQVPIKSRQQMFCADAQRRSTHVLQLVHGRLIRLPPAFQIRPVSIAEFSVGTVHRLRFVNPALGVVLLWNMLSQKGSYVLFRLLGGRSDGDVGVLGLSLAVSFVAPKTMSAATSLTVTIVVVVRVVMVVCGGEDGRSGRSGG